MTLLLVFVILLLMAALCFGLSRAVPTRLLGYAAAALCFGGAALLGLAAPPAPDAPPLTLLALDGAAFTLAAGLAASERAIAATLLCGGGAALLALAGAIAATVRGFGALIGWALICLAAALLSLAAPPLSLIHPLAWAVLTIAGYGALRASGVAGADEAPPRGLTLGLLASALLTVALLAGGPAIAAGALPFGPAAAAGLLAALALAGCPPLLMAHKEAVAGPAPLGALIFGLSAPAAALGWLLRATAALPLLPTAWAVALVLVGGLGALACGAGALGERRLRLILGWAAGAQAALVVAAAGLAGPLAALAGPSMLVSLMLATVLGAAAAVSFERSTGSDDYTDGGAVAPRPAGALWALGAAASLGLPPLWGFWGRLWLLEAALEQQPWLLAPLLAGAVLLALALLAPLAGLWAPADAQSAWSDWAPGLLALAPLLVLGVAPGLAWAFWLRSVPFAPPATPVDPIAQAAVLAAAALLALLALALARMASARSLARNADEAPTRIAPAALGTALRPLAWLGHPTSLLRGVWIGLERSSEALRLVIGLFEQRYYLLGVLVALLTIMLLMAQ